MELQTKGYKVLLMFYILNDIYKLSYITIKEQLIMNVMKMEHIK